MTSIKEQLQEELDKCAKTVNNTLVEYRYADQKLDEANEAFRKAKYNFGQAYKNWKNARKEKDKAERRLKSCETKVRSWTKNNPGKAIERVIG